MLHVLRLLHPYRFLRSLLVFPRSIPVILVLSLSSVLHGWLSVITWSSVFSRFKTLQHGWFSAYSGILNITDALTSLYWRSRAHPLQSRWTHLPSSELQCSSVPVVLLHPSHWRAISNKTRPIIHIRPTDSAVLFVTPLLSAVGPFQFPPPISLHISHQHRR